MQQPFQCIARCGHAGKQNILLAASGAWIYGFSLSRGSFLFRWSHVTGRKEETENGSESERPGKRRKLSDAGSTSDSLSADIVVNGAFHPRRTKPKSLPVPAIIKIATTFNGEHIVAVTNEDKCIRVLEVIADGGGLKQLSERFMPKKPCAVTFTSDDATILCADKFGDVYALPLFVPDVVDGIPENETTGTPSTLVKHEVSTVFIPSASELTVHTKRNQQALKNQQRQKNKTGLKKTFGLEQQRLLGHVSLLTDLIYVTLSAELCNSASQRSFIVTSDRDEHIRISRGLPQAHIIEAYCLEHTEFISRICIPVWNRTILISGGGDDYLLSWDWPSAAALQKIDLRFLVDECRHKVNGTSKDDNKLLQTGSSCNNLNIAVSGIWAMQTLTGSQRDIEGAIIVACEGLSALLVFSLTKQGKLQHWQTLETEGNVLDAIVLSDQQTIIYSMDNIHKANSTSILQDEIDSPFIGSYTLAGNLNQWVREPSVDQAATIINDWTRNHKSPQEDSQKHLGHIRELLYSIEKLRKRGLDDD